LKLPDTDATQVLFEAGRLALARKDWPQVGRCSQRWLSTWPGHAEGHYLAGVLAGNAERYRLAAKAFERALLLDDSRCDVAIHLARCLVRTGEHSRAAQLVRIARSDINGNAFLLDLAGSVLTHIGCHSEALEYYRAAVALAPDQPNYLSNLSACALFNGELQEARANLERGLQLNPNNARAWWQLARLSHSKPSTLYDRLQPHLSQWQTPLDLAYGHYGAGKLAEDIAEWPLAAKHYQQAAAQAKTFAPAYSRAAETHLVDTIVNTYDAQWLKRLPPEGTADSRSLDETAPLFIVGLPRTGTTLVDTILTAHPQVSGAGELQFFGLAAKALSGVTGPVALNAEMMNRAASVNPQAIAEAYWRASSYLGRSGRYRTDKLPGNFYHLGLIAKAFPKCKIVHLRRNALDACFAIYKQLFAGAYGYSYDLDDLAQYYMCYHRLMTHWRKHLGERLIEVDYEALVAAPEQEIRALLLRAQLPFESACLNFYCSKQAVATASAVQVRERPHTRSVGRWRDFEDMLQPLIVQLQAAGITVT
jgi:tetratricopeptide (TPR) repeat protein